MKTHSRFRLTHLAVLATALANGPALAGGSPIAINNAGFEANPVATNCFAGFVPTGWTLFDPNGIFDGAVDAVGGLNTQPGGPHFVDGAPEGDHVALVFLQGDLGGGPMGLTQVLGDVLEASTTYTLTVQVGNIASGQGPPPCDVFGFFHLDGFPGYRVQLLAGGVVVAEDDNLLTEVIPDGEFRQSIVTLTTGAEHAQLGQTLAIRLINLNMIDTPEDPGIEVDFDDIRLVTDCATTGDLNADAELDADDAAALVNVLLGIDANPLHVSRADLDCSGEANGRDVQIMISLLIDA